MRLEDDGDVFEKWKSGWIRSHFYDYEKIWSTFIGNDRRSNALTIDGISPEQDEKRLRVWQAIYTSLVNCYYIDECCSSMNISSYNISDAESYFSESRRLQDFISYVGIVRDMFERIDAALSCGRQISASFQEFYDLRNVILHGCILPKRINNGCLLVPAIATRKNGTSAWDDKFLWSDAQFCDFSYCIDFCEKTRNELFALINQKLPVVNTKLFELLGKLTIGDTPQYNRSEDENGMGNKSNKLTTFPSGCSMIDD